MNPTCISCSDGIKNFDESAVDCGGSECERCSDGSVCRAAVDCASGQCEGGQCTSCSNGINDGRETGVDCGGPSCPACDLGGYCSVDSDCLSTYCMASSVVSQDETSVNPPEQCTAVQPVLSARSCEHSNVQLRCPAGVIDIVDASYGRQHGAEVCQHSAISDQSCHAVNSADTVTRACEGLSFCEIAAANAVFGDPCVGTYKYLSVDYRCVADGAVSLCDSVVLDGNAETCTSAGTGWRQLFRQTAGNYRTPTDWLRYNADDDTVARRRLLADDYSEDFSKLDELEGCRQSDGKLHLKLVWPGGPSNAQEWKQTSNPATQTCAGGNCGVLGYEAVDINYDSNFWTGLERGRGSSFLDGSVSHHWWWYAVGSSHAHDGLIPGPGGTVVSVVELYAMCGGTECEYTPGTALSDEAGTATVHVVRNASLGLCSDEPPERMCDNGFQDNVETDLDCGGQHCRSIGLTCDEGQSCGTDEDCSSGQCFVQTQFATDVEVSAASATGVVIDLPGAGRYCLDAVGEVHTHPGGTVRGCDAWTGPDGLRECRYHTYGHTFMSLFASIGESCTDARASCGQFVGSSATIEVDSAVRLYLKVADTMHSDNHGMFSVSVATCDESRWTVVAQEDAGSLGSDQLRRLDFAVRPYARVKLEWGTDYVEFDRPADMSIFADATAASLSLSNVRSNMPAFQGRPGLSRHSCLDLAWTAQMERGSASVCGASRIQQPAPPAPPEGWSLLFRQTAGNYRSAAEWVRVEQAGTESDFSRLNELENWRSPSDGKLHLKLVWPQKTSGPNSQEWKQVTNPVTADPQSGVEGYEPIDVQYTQNHWGGLERSSGNYALIDGSVSHGYWWYAVGAATSHQGAIPGGTDVETVVELYAYSDASDSAVHMRREATAPPACQGRHPWAIANSICEAAGARLCTVDELRNGETTNTGCGYNAEQVWSSSECTTGDDWVTVHTFGPSGISDIPSLVAAGWMTTDINHFSVCVDGTADPNGWSGGCSSRGDGEYAGFWCAGSCTGTMEYTLPQGFDTAELTLGMHYDNANCHGTVEVGHTDDNDPSADATYEVLFDNLHFADKQAVQFTYRAGDTMRITESGTCIVHLYQLKVQDLSGLGGSLSRLSNRGNGQGASSCRPTEESLAVRCCADAAPPAEALFCKACSASSDAKPGDSCWGVLPISDTRRSCGCNSGGWQGSGVYYGGEGNCNQCGCWGGAFAGHRENGEQKGGLPSVGLKISVYSPPSHSLEVGQTDGVDHTDTVVQLRHDYVNPVIIAGIPSYNGRHEVAVRIRDVSASSFTMYLDEPACRDQWHMHETVSWMAIENGIFGSLQAGLFSTPATLSDGFDWVPVSLKQPIDGEPVIVTQIQTHRGGDWVTSRIRDITSDSFSFRLEEDNHRDPCRNLDTHGGSVCSSIDESSWHSTISFSDYSRTEVCEAHVYTRGTTCTEFCEAQGRQCLHAQDNTGSSCNLDGAHTRQDVGQNGCNQNWGNQICGCSGPTAGHVREQVGWVAAASGPGVVGSSFLSYEATIVSAPDFATGTVDDRGRALGGRSRSHINVPFASSFRNPPAVFGTLHYNRPDPATLRASQWPSASGFDVLTHEGFCRGDESDSDQPETIGILVLAQGLAGRALPPSPSLGTCTSCGNGRQDGLETDIDCGGPTCGKCTSSRSCISDIDCASQRCDAGTCVSCFDSFRNGHETDVDCGGPVCAQRCLIDQNCVGDSDCQSGKCDDLVCRAITPLDQCSNGLEDNFEVDLDCGGEICRSVDVLCGVGQACIEDSDCSTGLCHRAERYNSEARGVCFSCSNGVKDGDESDVDCGGTRCTSCSSGQACRGEFDCESDSCYKPMPAPVPSAPFDYIGCWVDNPSRAINLGTIHEPGLFLNPPQPVTKQACADLCAGYSYFGLQWHRECFCGNAYDMYGEAPESECNAPCDGNTDVMCGGGWRNSVYRLNPHGAAVEPVVVTASMSPCPDGMEIGEITAGVRFEPGWTPVISSRVFVSAGATTRTDLPQEWFASNDPMSAVETGTTRDWIPRLQPWPTQSMESGNAAAARFTLTPEATPANAGVSVTITFFDGVDLVGTTVFELESPDGSTVTIAVAFPGVERVTSLGASSAAPLIIESFDLYGLPTVECNLRAVSDGQCVSCSNGVVDGSEASVDCGGSCASKCSQSQVCNVDSDCASGMCGSAMPVVSFKTIRFESRAASASNRLSSSDSFTSALAAFNGLTSGAGYCSRTYEVGYDMANQAACSSGSHSNIGFHYTMPFDVYRDEPTDFQFRFHTDWGWGGFTCFGAAGSTKSDAQCTYHPGDIWGHIFFTETIAQTGSYEWEAVGFEGCCDGWQKLEVKLSCGDATGWSLVSTSSTYDCAIRLPAIDFEDLQFQSRAASGVSALTSSDTFTSALAAFNSLDAPGQYPAGAYCSRTLVDAYDMANQAACSHSSARGSSTNIGFHYKMPFAAQQTGDYQFRFHTDWGWGGFTCFGAAGSTKSDAQCTYHPGDIWGHIFFTETIAQTGSYEWEAVGFEGCCDGWQKLEISLPSTCDGFGTGWHLVSSAATFSCPTQACYEPSPLVTCNDGMQNNLETDVDCGGSSCSTVGKLCGPGQTCGTDDDCQLGGTCAATGQCSSCNDGVRNGDEVDVDCGGTCGKCGEGSMCYSGDDCAESLFCYTVDDTGGILAGQGPEITWASVVSNDGSTHIAWDRICPALPSMGESWTVKVTAGYYVDYFRPTAAMSACNFFRSGEHQLWSDSRTGPFVRLSDFEDSNRYGGSGWQATSDGRDYVTFWGSEDTTEVGGCCQSTSTYSGWGVPIDVHMARAGTCAGRATVDIARANETVSITDGAAVVETMFIRSAPPNGLPAAAGGFACRVTAKLSVDRGAILSFSAEDVVSSMCAASDVIVTLNSAADVTLTGSFACVNLYLASYRVESTCSTPWDYIGNWASGDDDSTSVTVTAEILSSSCDIAPRDGQDDATTVAVTLNGRPTMTVTGAIKDASCVSSSTATCWESGVSGVSIEGIVQSRCNAMDGAMATMDPSTVPPADSGLRQTNYSAGDPGAFMLHLPFTRHLARQGGFAELIVSKPGLSTSRVSVALQMGTVSVGNVFMVSASATPAPIAGACGNARDSGATVYGTASLRAGIYAELSTDPLDQIALNSGSYTFDGVEPGVYTVCCESPGMVATCGNVCSNGPLTPPAAQTILLPPTMLGNQVTTVMTWDPSPPTATDLDFHVQFVATDPTVENNGNCHVYYANMECGMAQLDRDNVRGGQYGGETMTMNDVYQTIYTVYVHCYSCYWENLALEDTGLTVKTFTAEGQVSEITLPDPTDVDNYEEYPGAPDGAFHGVAYLRLYCIDASVSPPAIHPARAYSMGTPVACTSCPCDAPEGVDLSTDEDEEDGPLVIAPGTLYDSSILTGGASQFFIFEPTPGYWYYTQAWLTTLGDSVMYLYEANQVAGGSYEPGTMVAYNDDRADPPSWDQYYGSSFWYQVPFSGGTTHYIIEVRAYGSWQTGEFQVLTEANVWR